jgi:hypothetical protein
MIDWTKITGFDWDEGNTRKTRSMGFQWRKRNRFSSTPLYWCLKIPDIAAKSHASTPWVNLTIPDCCI